MSGPTHFSNLTYPGDLAHQIRQREWERKCRKQIEAWERAAKADVRRAEAKE